MKISDISNEKQMVSARVNKYILDQYKKAEMPVTTVIESSLINFLRLTDAQKMKFLADNLPDAVEKEDIKPVSKKWSETLLKFLEEMNIPGTTAKSIIASSAVAAVAIIGGALLSSLKLFNSED
jgi:hypothetical protein